MDSQNVNTDRLKKCGLTLDKLAKGLDRELGRQTDVPSRVTDRQTYVQSTRTDRQTDRQKNCQAVSQAKLIENQADNLTERL
jgi:hypothetical protein